MANRPPVRTQPMPLRRGARREQFTIREPLIGITTGRNQSTASSVVIDATPSLGSVTIVVLGPVGGELIRWPLKLDDVQQLITALQMSAIVLITEKGSSD